MSRSQLIGSIFEHNKGYLDSETDINISPATAMLPTKNDSRDDLS